MGSKLVRGSFIILLGNVIFRFGGYIYRFLMATLLGPSMYGILGLTLPFQGIFQTLSAGGLPPAIAKYVAEYRALNEQDMARQTIYTSLKIMIFLGIFLGILMVLFVAPWLAFEYLKKPATLVPLQIVGLITPFSVIVGAFRGAFQGVYKMEYILYSRAVEQVGMIVFAVSFVIIGLSVVGALYGTVLGFIFSVIVSIYLFKNKMKDYIPAPSPDFNFPLNKEIKLAAMLLKFSIPVIITAIAEMLIYNICTIIMGKYLPERMVGYFAAADPIARLPLIVSTSIATTILPASSEAFASKNKKSLNRYVSQSYRYSMLIVFPLCLGITIFSPQILQVFYFTNSAYMLGSSALAILAIGMTFYSIFTITISIIQGIGNPRIPMYVLVLGAILTAILSLYLIPIMGIAGGALATTIACFAMMVPVLIIVFKLTKTDPPIKSISKIILASLIIGIILYIIPKSAFGLLFAVLISPIIYFILIVVLKFFTVEDINYFRSFSLKLGPLKGLFNKVLDLILKVGGY